VVKQYRRIQVEDRKGSEVDAHRKHLNITNQSGKTTMNKNMKTLSNVQTFNKRVCGFLRNQGHETGNVTDQCLVHCLQQVWIERRKSCEVVINQLLL
jgi:hypothetical protein